MFGLSSPGFRRQRPPDLFSCKARELYQVVFNGYSQGQMSLTKVLEPDSETIYPRGRKKKRARYRSDRMRYRNGEKVWLSLINERPNQAADEGQ